MPEKHQEIRDCNRTDCPKYYTESISVSKDRICIHGDTPKYVFSEKCELGFTRHALSQPEYTDDCHPEEQLLDHITGRAQSQPKRTDDLSVVEANYIARQLVDIMPRNEPFRIHSR